MAERIEANLRVVERRWQLDEEEVMDSEWERHALHLAERRAVRRASTLVRFQGRLVPIGEPDHAESPPREIIDLTDDSEDDVLDLSSEEEQQAREEEHMGVLTFHAEVECARADPAPEFEAPPPGYDAPGPCQECYKNSALFAQFLIFLNLCFVILFRSPSLH